MTLAILQDLLIGSLSVRNLSYLSGFTINHLACGHLMNHPARPHFPNAFVFDIEVPNHFLPASHYKYLPCAQRKPDPCKYVMGVFLSEETWDNTEIRLDLKDIYTPDSIG